MSEDFHLSEQASFEVGRALTQFSMAFGAITQRSAIEEFIGVPTIADDEWATELTDILEGPGSRKLAPAELVGRLSALSPENNLETVRQILSAYQRRAAKESDVMQERKYQQLATSYQQQAEELKALLEQLG